MDSVSISNRTLLTHFEDNTGKHALSVTYPVLPNLQWQSTSDHWPASGNLEASLAYPCFQLYLSTPNSVLKHESGQQQVQILINRIISDLERTKFIEQFSGVRFEIYDGRPEFSPHTDHGRPNRQCLQAIGDHAVNEREYRNTLAIFRAAVKAYSDRDVSRRLRELETQHASLEDFRRLLEEIEQAINGVCEIGSLISADIALYNKRRKEHHQGTWQPMPSTRRKSLSNLDTSQEPPTVAMLRNHKMSVNKSRLKQAKLRRARANSTGELQVPMVLPSQIDRNLPRTWKRLAGGFRVTDVPCRRIYMKRRIERLIRQLTTKFHTPITPVSFFSPPHQPWYSMVLIAQNNPPTRDELFIMRFSKGISINDVWTQDFSTIGDFAHSIRRVTVGFSKEGKQDANVSVLLGQYLHVLGLGNPATVPCGMRMRGTDYADPSLWLGHALAGHGGCIRQSLSAARKELEDLGMDFGNGEEVMASESLDVESPEASCKTAEALHAIVNANTVLANADDNIESAIQARPEKTLEDGAAFNRDGLIGGIKQKALCS